MTQAEIEILHAAAKVAVLYRKIVADKHPASVVVKDGKLLAVTIISEPLEKLAEAVDGMLRQPQKRGKK
jgi:hypothetical protein